MMRTQFISAIVILSIVLSLVYQPITVKASGNTEADNKKQMVMDEINSEEFWGLIATFIDDESCYSCENEELLNAYLGDLFQIPYIDENGKAVYDEDLWHAYIYKDEDVYAVIDFVVVDDFVFYSIGEGNAEEISDNYGKNMKMCFYEDEFVCMNKKAYTSKGDTRKSGLSKALSTVKPVKVTSNEFNAQKTVGQMIEGCQLSKADTETEITDEEDEEDIDEEWVDATSGATIYNKRKVLKKYPKVLQPNEDTCWAASIASMVRYELGKKVTPKAVCKAVNWYGGALSSKVREAMNYYFKSPYKPVYISDCLTKKQIKQTIKNNDPALMGANDLTGRRRHITVMIGYQIYGSKRSMRVKIMDPYSKKRWGNYGDGIIFTYNHQGIEYTWNESIRLFYE